MKLPKMRFTSGIKKVQQVKFAGLDHTLGGGEGSLWDMKNLTSDHFPLLATRAPRGKVGEVIAPMGLFSAGGTEPGTEKKLCYVANDHFYFDGVDKGALRSSCAGAVRQFAHLQGKVAIFPDKKYYDIAQDTMGDMEARWSGAKIQFQDDTYGGVPAEANTLYCEGADFESLFRVGDAVSIKGCVTHPENNQTLEIREIDGDRLRFYENSFTLGDGADSYQENGEMSISREVPDLVCVCAHNNRLWGADARTIYCGKLGDIFNWHDMDNGVDCWQWEPGSSGAFTACVSYRGYPVFFKEDMIYKIYGDMPSDFQALDSATLGVAEGGGRSLAVAGETLFYLSRNGVAAYQGGIPALIGQDMGQQRFAAGVAGSDGIKYYISLEDAQGRWRLYVYDTENGLWHIEDDTQAVGFARCDGVLYLLTAEGELLSTSAAAGEGVTAEGPVEWMAEFGDITEENSNKKGISRLQMRIDLEKDASVQVYIQYDSTGLWQPFGEPLRTQNKRSFILPVIPRRCDHYRLKLVGQGQCYIYSIAREFYVGSGQ